MTKKKNYKYNDLKWLEPDDINIIKQGDPELNADSAKEYKKSKKGKKVKRNTTIEDDW